MTNPSPKVHPMSFDKQHVMGAAAEASEPALVASLPEPVPVSASGDGQAQEVIARIVALSQAIGWQAGVGAMETAGSIVSYLHEHPEDVARLMGGSLSVIDWPMGWHKLGCLSWQGADGKVYHPEARAAQ